MPLSLAYLLLAILSLSHGIHCADNDTKTNEEVAFTSYHDGWFNRNIRITEPHTVLMWQGGSPHKRFYYLTWDGKKLSKNRYCNVTQVLTDSSSGASTTCQHKFNRNEYVTRIRYLDPSSGGSKSMIAIAYTTMYMDSNTYVYDDVDFKTCQRYGASESNQTDISSSPAAATAEEEDAKTSKVVQASDDPAQSSERFDIYSNANGRHSSCKVNDELTQITCKQEDKEQNYKVVIDVKYDLPTHWKADWFAVHNSKAGALLLYFSDCPNGACKDYSLARFTAKGWDGKRYVEKGMDLQCSDVSKISVDVTDQDNGWVCMHVMCSEVKTDETLLKYRRQCVKGDNTA